MKKFFFLFVLLLVMTGCNLFPSYEDKECQLTAVVLGPGSVDPSRINIAEGESSRFIIATEGIIESVTIGEKSFTVYADNSFVVNYEDVSDLKKAEVKIVIRALNVYDYFSFARTGGSVKPNGLTKVTEGGGITYTAEAQSGYNFIGWVVNNDTNRVNVGIPPTSFSLILNDADTALIVEALFEPKKTFSVAISSDGGKTTPANGQTFLIEGSSLGVNFTPDEGYEVESKIVNGTPVVPPTNSHNFINILSDQSISFTQKRDSIMWPLLKIKWKLYRVWTDNFYTDRPDGEIDNFKADGTFTAIKGGETNSYKWTLDRNVSPAIINWYGPIKLEKIDNEEMILSYINGYNQVVKYCFQNYGYK